MTAICTDACQGSAETMPTLKGHSQTATCPEGLIFPCVPFSAKGEDFARKT
jgi:hypothetical protein